MLSLMEILSHPSLDMLPGDFVQLRDMSWVGDGLEITGLKAGLADLKSISQQKSFHDSVILLPPTTQTTGRPANPTVLQALL